MTSDVNRPTVPAKHYFTLDEVCGLVRTSLSRFAQWQHENGAVVGYNGNRYTRPDVVKLLKLKDTFALFMDSFNHNVLDSEGSPAASAKEVHVELEAILADLEKTLASRVC